MRHSVAATPSKTQYNNPRLNTAYWLGQRDAKDGALCVPEMYFVRRDQMIAYARGFETVKVTASSRQILRGAK